MASETTEEDLGELSGESFRRYKNLVLQSLTPASVVPVATANAMLLIGSDAMHMNVTSKDIYCNFHLPELLLISGTVSTTLVLFGALSRYVVDWIYGDRTVTRGERRILTGVYYAGTVIGVLQLLMLCTVTAYLFYMFGSGVQSTDPKKQNYCTKQLVMFTSLFFLMTWLFLILAFGVFLYVKIVANREKDETLAPAE